MERIDRLTGYNQRYLRGDLHFCIVRPHYASLMELWERRPQRIEGGQT